MSQPNFVLQAIQEEASAFLDKFRKNFKGDVKVAVVVLNKTYKNANLIITDGTNDEIIDAIEEIEAQEKKDATSH